MEQGRPMSPKGRFYNANKESAVSIIEHARIVSGEAGADPRARSIKCGVAAVGRGLANSGGPDPPETPRQHLM